jgi:hypothetical protein
MSSQKESKLNNEEFQQKLSETGIDDSLKLRDFIYLDYPKLVSYYAQIRNGLSKEKSRIRVKSTNKTRTDPQNETSFTGGGSFGGSGITPPSPTEAQIIAALGRLEGQVSRLTRTGGDENSEASAEYLIETKEIHHEVLDRVLEVLLDKKLVSFDMDTDNKSPFHIISGEAHFIDSLNLVNSIKDFPAFGERFQKITGEENFAKSLENTEELSKTIENIYKNSIAIVLLSEGLTTSCSINPLHLTAPLQTITDNYGMITQVPITVFGLKVGSSYPTSELAGETTFVESRESLKIGLDGMGSAIFNASSALEGTNRFFRMRGQLHLYPIAVFVNLYD